jgi:hypothetical protein
MQPDLLVLCLTLLSGLMPVSNCLPVASACMSTGDGLTRCARELVIHPPAASVTIDQAPVAVPTSTPKRASAPRRPASTSAVKAPAAAPAPNPKQGGTPDDALDADDSWRTIGPKGQVWYKMGSAQVPRVNMSFWLDAKGSGGIGFAVYAPDQMYNLPPIGPPKGQGTRNRNDSTHDLNWNGQAAAGGTWYVLVTNSNPVALTYKVGSSLVVTGRRADCTGPYIEYLGGWLNQDVLWPGYCP